MRRRAREIAFKALFEHMGGGVTLEEAWRHALELEEQALDEETRDFAKQLIEGYLAERDQVDRVLKETIRGWTFSQMNQTDLTVLRLATYEALYLDTPFEPLIEVAVRIAKRYGGEDSGRFVNGVLARLLERIRSGELQAVPRLG